MLEHLLRHFARMQFRPWLLITVALQPPFRTLCNSSDDRQIVCSCGRSPSIGNAHCTSTSAEKPKNEVLDAKQERAVVQPEQTQSSEKVSKKKRKELVRTMGKETSHSKLRRQNQLKLSLVSAFRYSRLCFGCCRQPYSQIELFSKGRRLTRK